MIWFTEKDSIEKESYDFLVRHAPFIGNFCGLPIECQNASGIAFGFKDRTLDMAASGYGRKIIHNI
jgi:hypothetical protein